MRRGCANSMNVNEAIKVANRCDDILRKMIEGEVVYCGVAKSSVHPGIVDFAPYDDIKYNGTLTVTYLGQNLN